VVGSCVDDNAGYVTCWEFFDWLSNKYLLKNYLRLVTVVNEEHGRRRLHKGPHDLYFVRCDEIVDALKGYSFLRYNPPLMVRYSSGRCQQLCVEGCDVTERD